MDQIVPGRPNPFSSALQASNPAENEGNTATDLYDCCLQLFRSLVSTPRGDEGRFWSQQLRAQGQRFTLWGSNFDAQGGGLDDRLKNAPQAKRMLVWALIELGDSLLLYGADQSNDNFTEARSRFRYVKGQTSGYSPKPVLVDHDGSEISIDEISSTDSETTGDVDTPNLKSLLDDVRSQVACLYELGHILSEPAEGFLAESQISVARSFTDQEMRSGPAGHFIGDVLDLFPKIDRNFARRLGEANMSRCNRLKDSRDRHFAKKKALIASIVSEAFPDTEEETSVGEVDGGPNIFEVPESPVLSSQRSFDSLSIGDSSINSSTKSRTSSVTSFASSNAVINTSKGLQHIPKMPSEQPWGEPFDCPVCGETLSNVWSSAAWRAHVYRDLRPYVCCFDKCEKRDETIASRSQWAKHLSTCHGADHQWTCSVCRACPSDQQGLENHLLQSHPSLNAFQFDETVQSAIQSAENCVARTICPFCTTMPIAPKAQFISHVGRHMQEVSLLALPLFPTQDEEEQDSEEEQELEEAHGSDPTDLEELGSQKQVSDVGFHSPEPSGLTRLRQYIVQNRYNTAHGGHYFKPQSLLKLCTSEVIQAAVQCCPFKAYEKERITRAIVENRILTFCILVHIEQEHTMTAFLEHNMNDSSLPVEMSMLESIALDMPERFFEKQWAFIPIRLSKGAHLHIRDESILPFMKENRYERLNFGSSKKTSHIEMDASMQEMVDMDNAQLDSPITMVGFVRKNLYVSSSFSDFVKERSLKDWHKRDHPNITKPLCSFTYMNEYSLIFQLEKLNLHDFFDSPRRYQSFASNFTFYMAIYDLSSAVEYLHTFDKVKSEEIFSNVPPTFSLDIQPGNIMVRSDTFLLGDSSQGMMCGPTESSIWFRSLTRMYIAPEHSMKNGRITRAADIWSLGTLFLDLAIYIEQGPEGLRKLFDHRDWQHALGSDDRFLAYRRRKLQVDDFIDSLQVSLKDKTIHTLLLLAQAMLEMEPTHRPNARMVRQNAAYIAVKSLFREAFQRMIVWRQRSGETRPERTWEGIWKLWAWGEEIGVNGDGLATDKFKDAVFFVEAAKGFQTDLHKIVRILEGEALLEENIAEGKASTPLYRPEQNDTKGVKIYECIRSLLKALPQAYRVRIEKQKAYYGPFALEDPPRLPFMPDKSMLPNQAPVDKGKARYSPSRLADDPNILSPAIDYGKPPEGDPMHVESSYLATVTYKSNKDLSRTDLFNVHVRRDEAQGETNLIIICDMNRPGLSLRHTIHVSESAYPFYHYLPENKPAPHKLYFVGKQIIDEVLDSGSPGGDPAEEYELRYSLTRRKESDGIQYSFASEEACNRFRCDVWGKDLFYTVRVVKIRWRPDGARPEKETTFEELALWRENSVPEIFTMVFKDRDKGQALRLNQFCLAKPSIKRDERTKLTLSIEKADSEPPRKSVPVLLRKNRMQNVHIAFNSTADCESFIRAVMAADTKKIKPLIV